MRILMFKPVRSRPDNMSLLIQQLPLDVNYKKTNNYQNATNYMINNNVDLIIYEANPLQPDTEHMVSELLQLYDYPISVIKVLNNIDDTQETAYTKNITQKVHQFMYTDKETFPDVIEHVLAIINQHKKKDET